MVYRLAHVTDLHISPLSRVPRSRRGDYFEVCREEFRSLFGYVRGCGIVDVVVSGDVWNLKSQGLHTPETLNYYAGMLGELSEGLRVWVVPGNHDMPLNSYRDMGRTAYRALVGMLLNWEDVSFREVELSEGVMLMGFPYMYPNGVFMDAVKEYGSRCGGDVFNVVVTHQDLVPDGEDVPHVDSISYSDYLGVCGCIDVTLNGHIHTGFDVYWDGVRGISKPRAFGRVVKDYVDVGESGVPQVSIVSIGGVGDCEISYVDVPGCRESRELFIGDVGRELRVEGARVREFMEGLRSGVSGGVMSPEDYMDRYGGSLGGDVLELIRRHLEL